MAYKISLHDKTTGEVKLLCIHQSTNFELVFEVEKEAQIELPMPKRVNSNGNFLDKCKKLVLHDLRSREMEFVRGLIDRTADDPLYAPTNRQLEWLNDIYKREECGEE